jgi:hypothetical protein
MIHYIDVSGSMNDDNLVKIAKVILREPFQSHDKIFTISTSIMPVPDRLTNEFDLPSYLVLEILKINNN